MSEISTSNHTIDSYHKKSGSLSQSEINWKGVQNLSIPLLKKDLLKNDVFFAKTKAEQIYKIRSILDENMKEKYSFENIGSLFNMSKETARSFFVKGRKYNLNNNYGKVGKPSKLTETQIDDIIEKIIDQENLNEPFSREELLDYIYKSFNVTYTNQWIDKFIEMNSNKLSQEDAYPLEELRAELSRDQLKYHMDDLLEFIEDVHPQLLINIDESGLDQIKNNSIKKVIVSHSNIQKKRFYKSKRDAGHITFLCAIPSCGEFIRPMIIITRKSIDNDLLEFGYPNGPGGYVVQSNSGFINKDLFLEWLKVILIPWVEKKRIELNDPNAIAGVILDGCTSHTYSEIFQYGNQNNIIFYLLPAHSSHITQPLDQLIFSLWKNKIKKTKTKKILSKQSERIYIAARSLFEVSTFFNIKSSFSKAGIIIKYDGFQPKITTDIEKLYKTDLSPNEDVNKEEIKKKINRVKVLSSKNENEKKRKIKEKEKDSINSSIKKKRKTSI
jgi:hypothetical protein